MPAETGNKMPRDIASAYLATGARLAAWFMVAALVYRRLGADYFAVLALVRATIGLLNYTTLGLSPAMVHYMAGADRGRLAGTDSRPASALREIYAAGRAVAWVSVLVGAAALLVYTFYFGQLHHIPLELGGASRQLVLWFGAGVIARLASDPGGAVLQINAKITLDNLVIAGADVLWAAISMAVIAVAGSSAHAFGGIGAAYFASGVLLFITRRMIAWRIAQSRHSDWRLVTRKAVVALLTFGVLVTLAQLADYLYAPTDYILISRLLTVDDLARYAPAVQVDAALLLAVAGLSAVILPKSAIAFASGDWKAVQRYYLRGTAWSIGLLLAGCGMFWLVSPIVFKVWFGDSLPGTRLILPLVLLHTLVGGSSAVGRAILLGTGYVKAFTASVLIAGTLNVVLSYTFVRYMDWGLNGIILGTIVAVTLRCAVWMPWYTLRVLRTIRHS